MDENTQEEVLAAVAKWRPRLRLNDWSISFVWDDPDVDVIRVFTEERYQRAKLHVAPDFPHLDKDDIPGPWLTIEKMVVHELCHLVVSHLHITGRSVVVVANVGKAVEEQAFDRLDGANERVTELVARIVWEAWEHTAWDSEPP